MFERNIFKKRIKVKRDPYLLTTNKRKVGVIKKKQEKNKKESIEQNLEDNDFE